MNTKALTMSLLVAIIMLLPFAASAQRSDSFFSGFEDDDYENRIASFIGLGNQPFGTEPAPVGSGLLVLTVAGAGYAALRRKRSDKSGKSHKTYTTCVLALAMVLAFTGCKKKIEPIVNSGETAHITLNVGNGNRHIIEPNESGYVPVSYSAGDVIYVGDGTQCVGQLSWDRYDDNNNSIFSGSINEPSGNKIYFYFIGGKNDVVASGTTSFTVDISDQHTNLPVLSCKEADYYSGKTEFTCMLENKCALVEFKFENGTNNKTTKISNMLCEAKIDFANGCITPTEKLDAIALYNDPNDNDKKVKWAVLLFGVARKSMGMVYRETQLYKTQNIDLYDYYDGVNVPLLSENNNYLYGQSAINVDNSSVENKVNNKVFVVSANGNAVRFAHGNLKCTKTGVNWSDGYTWSFMTNQYDRLNTSNGNVGTDYSDRTEIDLFGWGCTGFQDNTLQTCFEPYHTTLNYNAYGPAGGFLSVIGKSDWGAVNISNSDGYNWRTLTAEEMEYMRYTRYNADSKRGAAQVIGVNGVIVLPEQWNGAGINSNYNNTWTDNIYDSNTWQSMETNGALFLPLTGYRKTGPDVKSATSNGYYWTSSENNDNQKANCLYTTKNGWSVSVLMKAQGAAVRLVR